ncbi:MAG: shikimate dehydrogenase [Nitrospinae bacterium]|nr:shikimate dehydrogenase [Nitrospinota bacterium]
MGTTKALGIFGWPISHTLSPAMHNFSIRECGLDYTYIPFAVSPENLAKGVEAIRTLGFRGINVTIPHKEKIIPYLDELDCGAELIGAVNTVVCEGDTLVGYNTDGAGFIESLKETTDTSPRGKRVVIFGAGGAAKGIAVALLSEGIEELIVVNRSGARGKALASNLKTNFGVEVAVDSIPLAELSGALINSADILINATSVGMKNGDSDLFDYDIISEKHIVCDIVYRPLNTTLLEKASQSGAKTVNGLGMLIHQGALSFRLWTGAGMPVDKVRRFLEETLREEQDG